MQIAAHIARHRSPTIVMQMRIKITAQEIYKILVFENGSVMIYSGP
jgi:hypothetical protein